MKFFLNCTFILLLLFSGWAFSVQESPVQLADSNSLQGVGGCPGLYPSCNTCGSNSCGQTCCARESEPGFEINYPDDCTNWTRPNLVATPPGLICHLDIDRHLFNVDVEIYAVDLLQDTSCAQQPLRYNKVKKATVSCSYFTSIFNSDVCARRIESKIAEVANMGYVPIFLDADRDYCPRGTAACSTDSQCSNGIFCDGVESCVAGQCMAGPRSCAAPGLTCNENQAICVGVGTGCSSDAQCDNGLFCDGVEQCTAGVCQSGTRPCDLSVERCSEAQNRCLENFDNCGTGGQICR